MIDILVFGAHPDDIEFGCGGILVKSARQQKSIVLVDLTIGEKGTNGNPEIRKRESQAAAELIGAQRIFLDFSDCEIIDDYEGRLKLVKVIRQYRPKLVLAPMWNGEQNHPDHIACGSLARAACRYARFPKILPDVPTHKVEGILHYLYLNHVCPDFLVDISDCLDLWKKMISCHESQMLTFDYLDWNLKVAAKWGTILGTPYAQGLVKGNPVVVEDIMSIAKGSREI